MAVPTADIPLSAVDVGPELSRGAEGVVHKATFAGQVVVAKVGQPGVCARVCGRGLREREDGGVSSAALCPRDPSPPLGRALSCRVSVCWGPMEHCAPACPRTAEPTRAHGLRPGPVLHGARQLRIPLV